MKKFLCLLLALILFASLAPMKPAKAAVYPMECGAPGYANWANAQCLMWIYAQLWLYGAEAPGDDPRATPPQGSPKEPKAKAPVPGDGDGISG